MRGRQKGILIFCRQVGVDCVVHENDVDSLREETLEVETAEHVIIRLGFFGGFGGCE